MSMVEAFHIACRIDWGTVPQWLTFFTIAGGLVFTHLQLRHNRYVRETENILSVSDSTITHNSLFLGRPEAQEAIKSLEGLNTPDSADDAKTYWAVRWIHLSHINLIWRAWELAGRPGPGETIRFRYDGWERFAREIVTKKLKESVRLVQDGAPSPADFAESDLWLGLNTYEIVPIKFVKWLDSLDSESNNRRV